ncbi:hypothetical protein G9A89_006890 [Geosiphon pyriformis]|nr:hypothetical protein G9A89_006890 [Geosiphon pyriformis]
MSAENLELDYYDLLEVNYNSTVEEIEKAYRQKARKYHPDKNRKNPEAAIKIFHQVSKAFELLSDPIKKREYDNLRKARIANKERYNALDAKRKVMKEDLEEAERAAKKKMQTKTYSVETAGAKIERLKADTARRRQEKEEKLRQRAADLKASKKSSISSNSFGPNSDGRYSGSSPRFDTLNYSPKTFSNHDSNFDYEAITLMKLRQAEKDRMAKGIHKKEPEKEEGR